MRKRKEMSTAFERRRLARLRIAANVIAYVVVLLGLLALAGWQLDLPALKIPFSTAVPINPFTATCLIGLSVAFVLISGEPQHTGKIRIGRMLLLAVSIATIFKLLNYFGVVEVSIDELLYRDELIKEQDAGYYTKMAPNAALGILLTALAMALIPLKSPKAALYSQYISLLSGITGFFSIVGHIYRVKAFYGVFVYIPMSFHTATSIFLLSLAVLLVRAGEGWMKTIVTYHAGGTAARYLIPTVLVIPVILGWIRLYIGSWKGFFGVEFSVTMLVMSIIIFFVTVIWYTVQLLNKQDTAKEDAALALQLSEEAASYQAMLLQNISDAVISTDIDFKVLTWNKAAETLYGWKEPETLGRPIAELLRPVYENITREEILTTYFQNDSWKGELLHHKRNGEQIPVLVSTNVIKVNGQNSGTVAVIKDMTEIKRSEKNFLQLLDAAPDATIIVESNGEIQMVNKRAEEVFMYNRAELLGHSVELLMPMNLKTIHQQHVADYVKDPKVRPMGAGMELLAKQKNGNLFPVEISLSPLKTEKGLLISASIRDISERRNIEAKLRQFNEELEKLVESRTKEILQINVQLRQLSSRLEETREQERIRISREIHDELGQQLTGLKMDIAWLAKKTSNEVALTTKFSDLLKLVDIMMTTVRRISSELRPAILDDLGLIAALEWASNEFEKRFQIQVNLSLPTHLPQVPEDIVTGLFRVYQETLTNIARHANASQVYAALTFTQNSCVLKVQDNGRGFDAAKNKAKKTLGILGMKERVAMMKGNCDITSVEGTGTVVLVEVPL